MLLHEPLEPLTLSLSKGVHSSSTISIILSFDRLRMSGSWDRREKT